ncbi:MAG: CBS domain-containing protein [Burkholderiales bacterium]|nr:CBS domain-containing protein [Burkholderiales bacterium]
MKQLNLPVEEFTTPDPVTADENMEIDAVRQLMADRGIRHLPIVRGDKVVGVISDRDVRVVWGLSPEHRHHVRAADIMAADLVTVRSAAPLDEVAYLMSDKKVGSVLVYDNGGRFLGIFTLTDALNALIEIARASGSR